MTVNPFAAMLRKAVDDGYCEWARKPHNEKWARKIDGTPIPNDLVVCIQGAVSRAALAVTASEAKLAQSEADNNGLVELVKATHENNEALRSKLAVAVDALYGVDIYGSDTLSGRSDGPNDAAWYRDGVEEMRDRARAALAQIKGDE